LSDPGINPLTGENVGAPLPAAVYSQLTSSVYAFDSFNIGTNFRQPSNPANQNGIVFFPGSTPIYVGAVLKGGFGVSGDGVNQDDYVTYNGAAGYLAPASVVHADQVNVRGVSLPYFIFPRNPTA
jgi:autotransporter adhesin